MPETTPLIKAALNLRGGAGFDVYHTVPVLLHSAVLQGLLYVYKKSAAYNFSVICSTLIILLIWNMAYLLYNTLSGHSVF